MDVKQIVTGMGELLRATMGGVVNVERVLKPISGRRCWIPTRSSW